MKKVLWSITAATLIILTGCSNTAATTQPEDRLPPPPPAVESVLEPDGPVESEMVALSAGNHQLVDNATVEEDTEAEGTMESESQAELPEAPQPQEPQASVRASVTFVPDSKSETVENPSPAPSETHRKRRRPRSQNRNPRHPLPRLRNLNSLRNPCRLLQVNRLNPPNPHSASTTGSAMHRSTPGAWG